MPKQKISGLSAALLETHSLASTEISKPVVQTVKVPPDTYIRLKTFGARERRSSQDIILDAIREYLNTRESSGRDDKL